MSHVVYEVQLYEIYYSCLKMSQEMYKQCRYRQVSVYNAKSNCFCDMESWIPPRRLFDLETPNQEHDAKGKLLQEVAGHMLIDTSVWLPF